MNQRIWAGWAAIEALALVLSGCQIGKSRPACESHGDCGACGRCDTGSCETDASLLNACGQCAPTPAELCGDALDNDCDGQTDELECLPPCLDGVCEMPPPTRCLDASTLRVYDATGTCTSGGCEYGARDIPCELGCDDEKRSCKGCDNACTPAGTSECLNGQQRVCIADVRGCLAFDDFRPCASGLCDDGESCLVCQNECASGAVECTDGRRRQCQADANGCRAWSSYTACDDGFCADAQTCGTCEHECSSIGLIACDAGQRRVCESDAHGCRAWSSYTACDDGFCASSTTCGTCVHTCAPGASECKDGKLRACVADANGCRSWGPYNSCPRPFCAEDGATCGSCNDTCPTRGGVECNEVTGSYRTCDADERGCLAWSSDNSCPLGTCESETTCQGCDNTCPSAGATECEAGLDRTCQSDLQGCLAWSGYESCSDGFCADGTTCGTCNNTCAEGAKECTGGKARTCVADSHGCLAWSAYEDCASGFCAADNATCGQCDHQCDTVGDKTCEAGAVSACIEDTNHCRLWSSKTACESWQVCGETDCVTGTPPAVVLINEILYDAVGADTATGNNLFLELWGPPNQSLAGYEVVGINAEGGVDYNAILLDGESTDTSGYFLIAHPAGDPSLVAIADMTSTRVDFQNGPDSVQVRWHGVVVDALGYGAFSGTQLFAGKGSPAAASGAGNSLTRDGAHKNTGDNAIDFVTSDAATPGANSCVDACSLDETQCEGGQIRSCALAANGCLAWGDFAPCSDGFCASATSCGECTNTCSGPGEAVCAAGRIRTCQEDTNGCLAVHEAACPLGVCADGNSCITVAAVATGLFHTCALLSSGGVKCWGYDHYGQLGDGGTNTNQSTPVDVYGLASNVTAITAGAYHTCALSSGGVKCWGYDEFGQLGDGGTNTNQSTPVDVYGLESNVTAIAAVGNSTCALSSGGVKCWGSDDFGQLGDGGSNTNQSTPVNVSGLTSGVTAIAAGAGAGHVCVRLSSGGVKCWGNDEHGQLGNGGSNTNQSTPVSVSSLASGVDAIAMGGYHTCALLSLGGVKCWGYDYHGQLGNGAGTADQSTPVDVSGLTSGVAAIAAGGGTTCALLSSGGAKCWGNDSYGQLGDGGSNTNQSTPVDVSGLTSGVAAIAAGGHHTCALLDSGGLKCWGWDAYGQLGDGGSNTDQSTPVDVVWTP